MINIMDGKINMVIIIIPMQNLNLNLNQIVTTVPAKKIGQEIKMNTKENMDHNKIYKTISRKV